jgi:hypothetical protein
MYVDSERAVVWECNQYPNAPYHIAINNSRQWKIQEAGGIKSVLAMGFGHPYQLQTVSALRFATDVQMITMLPPRTRLATRSWLLWYRIRWGSWSSSASLNTAMPGQNTNLGWTLNGHCTETVAPMSSPVQYSGPCPSWSQSDSMTYKADTRVRKGNQIFQCLGYPKYLWWGRVSVLIPSIL